MSAVEDLDRDAVEGVVDVPTAVPRRLCRLRVALGVGCPAAQFVVAGPGVPQEAPADPGARVGRRFQLGSGPGRTAVDTDVDSGDRRLARPCPSEQIARAGTYQPCSRHEL